MGAALNQLRIVFVVILVIIAIINWVVLQSMNAHVPDIGRTRSICPQQTREYLEFITFCPSSFEEQMELLKQKMGVEQTYKFKYLAEHEMMPIGSSWNIVLQNVLFTTPHHFERADKIPSDELIPLFIKTKCFPSFEMPLALIQNGYAIPPKGFEYSISNQQGTPILLAVRKVDTAVMCSAMQIRNESMQCPLTYIAAPYKNEISQFEIEARQMNESWIWKPDSGTQGAGMLITNNITEMASYARGNINEKSTFVFSMGMGGVIQKILPNPLLVEGKRFSIRMHVVVTSLNPFKGFISAHSYVVLAAGEKDGGSTDASIITNDHYNTELVNGFSQKSLLHYFHQHGLLEDWLTKSIPAMRRGFHEFLKQETVSSSNRLGRFELHGCDVLLDANMMPWLLECNRCAGVRKFLKNRITLYQELIYILLYSQYVSHDVPLLKYWEPLISDDEF